MCGPPAGCAATGLACTFSCSSANPQPLPSTPYPPLPPTLALTHTHTQVGVLKFGGAEGVTPLHALGDPLTDAAGPRLASHLCFDADSGIQDRPVARLLEGLGSLLDDARHGAGAGGIGAGTQDLQQLVLVLADGRWVGGQAGGWVGGAGAADAGGALGARAGLHGVVPGGRMGACVWCALAAPDHATFQRTASTAPTHGLSFSSSLAVMTNHTTSSTDLMAAKLARRC